VTGVVETLGLHRWADGSVAPQLTLKTTEGVKTLTASQSQLKRKLAGLKPDVGDTLSVEYTGQANLPGGKTAKEFVVNVTTGTNGEAAPAPKSGVPANDSDIPADALAALKAAGVVS